MLPEFDNDPFTEFDGAIKDAGSKQISNEKKAEVKRKKSVRNRPHIKHVYNFAALEREFEKTKIPEPVIDDDSDNSEDTESEDEDSPQSDKKEDWDDNLPAGFNLLRQMKKAQNNNIDRKAAVKHIISDIKCRYDETTETERDNYTNIESCADSNKKYDLDQDLDDTLPKAHFLIQQIKSAKAKLAENMENNDSDNESTGNITVRINRERAAGKEMEVADLEKYDHQATEALLDRLSYEMHHSLEITDSGYFSTSKYVETESIVQTEQVAEEFSEELERQRKEQLAARRAAYKKWCEKKRRDQKLKLERERKAREERELQQEINNTRKMLQSENFKSWVNRKNGEQKLRNLASTIRKSIEQRQLDEVKRLRAEKLEQKRRLWEERKIREARNRKEQKEQEEKYKATLSDERERRAKLSFDRWISTAHLKPLPTPSNRGEFSLEVRNIGWINPNPWRVDDDPSESSSSDDSS